MMSLRKLVLLTVGAIVLCGVAACSSGTELNPQPLPPEDPTHGPAEKGSANDNGGTGAAPTPPAADAGAADGGDAEGGGDH